MKKATILLIEDEKHIIELIKYNLEQVGFEVRAASDGKSGLEKAIREKPDLILLDLMLPTMDGIEICKTLKQNYKTQDIPIIMLTARSEEADIVLGLELGADDYMTKPFSPKQLVARVKAVIRRLQPKVQDKIFRFGTLELDTNRHTALLSGKPIDLTSKEFLILKLFAESSGRVLSREQILEKVWGHDESLDVEIRAVDKHIGELRKKLKTEAERIDTIKNFGYRFAMDEIGAG